MLTYLLTYLLTYFLTFTPLRGLSKIEYGVVQKFALKLNVENRGENAFLSKMTVQFEDDFEPIGVKFVNVSYSFPYAMLFVRAQNENFDGDIAEVGIRN